MLLSLTLGGYRVITLASDLQLSQLRVNGVVMGCARVWLAFICAASILVSAIDAPLSETTTVCQPCPDECNCLQLSDGTCSVDCASAGLSVFPSDLPPGKTKIVLDLDNNNLTELLIHHLVHLDHLKSVCLANNPWFCGCTTYWSSRWLEESAKKIGLVIEKIDDTRCYRPLHLKNVPLMQIGNLSHLCMTPLDLISYVTIEEISQAFRIEYMVQSDLRSGPDDCDQFCFDQDFPVAALSTVDHLCRCGRPVIPSEPSLSVEPAEGSLVNNKFYIQNAHFVNADFYFRMKQMSISSLEDVVISVHLPIVPFRCDWRFGENELQTFQYSGIACRLLHYRYIWPGSYIVSTIMTSVNGSVQASRNVSIAVQDPVRAVVLPFRLVVPAHRPLNVTIMMSSGTNVSITWNIMNSGKTIEIGAVDRLINVPKYVAGIGQFSQYSGQMLPSRENTAAPPISPSSETTLYLFPGWWFTHSGILQKWIYYRNISVTGSILHFQVYRPHCVNATSNLLHPGINSEFTTCSTDEQFSTFEHYCSTGLQYCPLSGTCQLRQSPCTCHMPHISGTESCVNTTTEWHQLVQHLPNYILIGDWSVDDATGEDVGLELSTDLSVRVQRNDIIGLQFVSEDSPVRCIHDNSSPWRQLVLAIHQSSWKARGTDISMKSLVQYVSVLNDIVCDVMAIYSTPEPIRSQLSVSLLPGEHNIFFNLSNLISYQTETVELSAVAEIEEFRLMYPTQDMFKPPISSDYVGKLIVEADTYITFVFSVPQGSTVHLTNSIDSTQIQFEPVCPVNLPTEFICNRSLSYAVREVAFTAAQNISGLRIEFRAQNEIDVKTIVCDILSLKRIRDINLTRNAVQGWPSLLDINIFSAVVSGDVLISSYHWTTSDNELATVSESPELKHFFSTAGRHTVSVNVSNDLSFKTAALDVTLYQPSDVNISLAELPDAVLTGSVVAVPVLLEMKPYSIVRCNFTVVYDSTLTVNTTSVVYLKEDEDGERFKKVSFLFNVLHSGVYVIQLVAYDELMLPVDSGDITSRVSAAITAEDSITGLELSISSLTPSDNFTYLLTASVTTGSNMTLSFKIGRSVVITSQLSIKYTFLKSGLHLVQLVASNRVSRSRTNLTVDIDSTGRDLIDDLGLVGCCSEIFTTETNVSFAMKVHRDLQNQYSCTWLIVHKQELITYHEGYHVTFHVRSPGSYSVTVELKRYEIKHIITDEFIVQEPISFLHLYTNAGFDGVFIHQQLLCAAVHTTGSHLNYQWNITAPSGIFEMSKMYSNRMTALFYSNDTYEVHVFVTNDISNASASAVIQVLVCNPPMLQLVGSTRRQELRSQRIAVEVIVQSCIFYQASHKWIVYRENCSVRVERVPLPPSVTTDTSALHLPPRTLPYGMYCLYFSSEYVKTVNRSEIYVDLAIVASPLKALIFGGDERALNVNEKIILDGTQSYDPDVDEDDPSHITYYWSCQTTLQTDSRDCFKPSNQSIYELPPHTFTENKTYVISLSVSSCKRGQTQGTSPSTAVQKIHGKSADVLQVSIDCISCRDKNLFAITRSQIIKLVGNCIGESCQESDEYSWLVTRNDSYELPLNSETTTTTGGNKRNLVVREFILNCSFSYTFTLHVSSSIEADVAGYASIVLKPLEAPKNGTCSLRIPASGFVEALVNPVYVVCSGWIDDASSASQLEYHIYVNETDRLNPRWYPLYRGPRGNLTFYLSPFRGNSELVQLSVQVIDSERSMTKAVKQLINVTSPPSRMDLLSSLIFEELEQEINHNDPRQIIPRIIAILLQLNIESRTGNNSHEAAEERERMRSELMMYLNQTMTYGAIQDMQQVAFAMQLVTDIPREFPRNRLHYNMVLKTLQDLIEMIKPYISQGWQGEEFMPAYLIDTSTNLIDNLYFLDRKGDSLFDPDNLRHQKMIRTAADLVDLIMIILFQTKIADEEPVSFYTSLVHCWGHRVSSRNVLLTFTSPYAVVSYPEVLSSMDQHMEIFQYVSTFDYNPFQWGYLDGSPITSKVVTVSFFDTQGQEITLPALPDDQGIEVSIKISDDIPKEIDDGYWTDPNQPYTSTDGYTSPHQPSSSVVNSVPANVTDLHISLLPHESKSALIKLSASNLSAVALTFKVVTDANNGTLISGEPLDNITMMVFFGQNYVPHKYKSEYSFQLVLQRNNISGRYYGRSHHFLSSQLAMESNRSFYLTVVNNDIEHSLEIALTFHAIHCKYFNKEGGFWDTNGCTAVNSTEEWTTCKCSSLMTVGASNIPTPAMLEFVPLAGMVFSGNPIIIATVLVVLMFVIVGFVLAWYWDHLEMVRSGLVPQCGRDGPFRYEVLVFTGRRFGSGTTANVGMRLFGEAGRSQNVHLFRPGAFRRGGQDRFVIASESSLGPVKKLVIWHDNSGSHPDWSLARVAVRDLQTNAVYHFLANCTLSLKSSKSEIETTLTVATEGDLSRFCNCFRIDLSYRQSEQHLWLSVFDCCSCNRYSHTYRLLCCATSLCCIMAICTIYYGVMEQQSDYEDLMGESSFRAADVLLAAISCAISFICSTLLLEIFRATKQQVSLPEMLSRRHSVSVTIEMDCDINGRQSSHFGSFSTFDRPKMNALNPSDLLELDVDRMSDSTSLSQPVVRKQLHRTSVLTSSRQSVSFLGKKTVSSRTLSNSFIPSQSDDSHLWSSEMILKSWPQRVNDLSTVDDDRWLADSVLSCPEVVCQNATKGEPSKRLASTSAPNITHFTQSSEASEGNPGESLVRLLKEGLSEETAYDSGAILSVQDEGDSVDDVEVYRIPVQSSSCPSSIDLKAEHCQSTGEAQCSNSNQSWRHPFVLPSWFSYVSWLLCIGIICGAMIVILVIGHQFNTDLSLRWFAVSCSAFLLAAVILETLKILVISVIHSVNMKLVDLDAYQIFQRLSLEGNEQFKSIRIRPLAGFALLQAKEDAKKTLVLHSLLRKFFIYVGFLVVVFAINYSPNTGSTAFLWSKSMDAMLVQMHYNKNESFQTISCYDDYWDWLDSVFANQLCTGGHGWNDSTYYQYLLGPSRLRQMRSRKVSCLVRNKYGDKIGSEYDSCDGDPGWHEDTATYHPQWKPAFEEANDTWRFQSAHSLNSIPYRGNLSWYGGGGYVSVLPSSYMEALMKINQLRLEDWIDDGTRIVMLEFTVYNGNVDLFASVIMAVEFGLTGAVYSTWNMYIFHPFVYSSANVTALITLESILLIYSIYLTIAIILAIRKSCVKSLKDIWTYFDVLIACLCWSSIILFTAMVIIDTWTIDYMRNSNASTFADFRESGTTHFAWVCVNSLLLMLTLILAVKQLRFLKLFASFYLTFRASFCVIFGCTLIYSLLMVIHSLTAYLLFGSELLQFHSVGAAFVTLVAIVRGNSQVMAAMGEAHLGFSIVFIAVYLSAILFGVHSLIAGAFAQTYRITRKQINYHNAVKAHDHEIILFLMKRLKKFFQKDKSKAAFRRVKFQDFSTLSSVSNSRSIVPDDALSAKGDDIPAESENSSELHSNDSSVVHSTETTQDNLHSSLSERNVTTSGTTLSSSVAEVTILSVVEDNAGQEIASPNMASCQQNDIIDGQFGQRASSVDDDTSECHANTENVFDDTDYSSVSTSDPDPVESLLSAFTRVLQQLDEIGSKEDDLNRRVETTSKNYLRKRLNYSSNSNSHRLVDEQTGLTKILQEANSSNAVVCCEGAGCSSTVEVLAMPMDLENRDMTSHDSVVPMRTMASADRLLANSQETWV